MGNRPIERASTIRIGRLLLWLGLLTALLPVAGREAAQAAVAPETAVARGITLLASHAAGVTFDLRPPPLESAPVPVDGTSMLALTLPGYGRLGQTGAPDLPQLAVSVALPPGATPRISVQSLAQEQRSSGPVAPPTVQTLVAYDVTDPLATPEFAPVSTPDPAVYAANRFFPAETVVVQTISSIRQQRVAHLLLRPVQVNSATGELRFHTHLRVTVTFEGAVENPAPAGADSATFENLLAATLLNYDAGRDWRTAAAPTATLTSPCLDENAFRIAVTATGMHEIRAGTLQSEGFPAGVDQDKLRLCYEDSEVAVQIIDRSGTPDFTGSDGLLFYGQAIKTQETETNVYWLTYGDETAPDGLRMATTSGPGSGSTPADYPYPLRAEQDLVYISRFPMNDTSDHWYWQEIAFGISGISDTLDVDLTIPDLAPAGHDVPLAVQVSGHLTIRTHVLEVTVNGTPLTPTLSFTASGLSTPTVLTTTFPSALLQPGSNTLTLRAVDNATTASHLVWVDWLTLTPRRSFVAQDDRLLFTQETSGPWTFSLNGFSTQPRVFDVSEPEMPLEFTNVTGGGAATFTHTSAAPSDYAAVTEAGFIQVGQAAIQRDAAPLSSGPALQDGGRQADYLIITDPALEAGLADLIPFRENQGLAVDVVYVQDIFDEFSYGRYDPEAIRRFLAYTFSSWQSPAPSFVLLAGDGSYDHRNLLGLNGSSGNLVPVYLKSGVDSNVGETAADNMYVDFLGDELPEMHIGRLPAQSAAELHSMVDRIITYETAPWSSWHGKHLFVTDNGLELPACDLDPAGNFFATVDAFIEDHFPVPVFSSAQSMGRLYYAPASCYPAAVPHYRRTADAMESDIMQALFEGRQFVVYTGHSGSTFWSKDGPSGFGFFSSSLVESNLQNGARTPIMLPMTCLEGSYHRPQFDSLSEALLKKPSSGPDAGGAVASYAPTGLQVQQGHDFLLNGFYDGAFTQNLDLLGEAVYAAKVSLNGTLAFQDLHDTFMLLGDPAMDMRIFRPNQFLFTPVAPRSQGG